MRASRIGYAILVLFYLQIVPKSGRTQQNSRYGAKIFASDNKVTLAGVNVLNITQKKQVLSDTHGNFSIAFTAQDTLEFRHKDYEILTVIAPLLEDSIFLTKKSIELQEVIVVHNKQNSRLDDLENIHQSRNKQEGIYYQGRPPLALLSPFGGKPITFFYELLSKHGKNARKMTKAIATETNNEKVDIFFNKILIKSIVPIDDKDLTDFMIKYRPAFPQVQWWSLYDAHVYIKKSYQTYLSCKANQVKK